MSPCTPVIGCRAAASSLRKGSTKVLTDLMYLMENEGYCINRFAECEGDVGGCDPQQFKFRAKEQIQDISGSRGQNCLYGLWVRSCQALFQTTQSPVTNNLWWTGSG